MAYILQILITILPLLQSSLASGNGTNGIQTLLDDMLSKYDNRIRPGQNEGTTTIVTFDMFINEFSSVNENSMDYSINLYFRQRWKDPRLAYDEYTTPITLGYSRVNEIWVPDTFFNNEKRSTSHTVTVPNILLRLYPDGSLVFSQRLSLTLSCPMFLADYPMDTQRCPMKMESYGFTTTEVNFDWTNDNPVIMNQQVELPEFEVDKDKPILKNCTISYNTGSYSCLEIEFKLTRLYGFYVTGTYVPSTLIVLLSFISFFVDVRATPARISLGLLTVLSITTMNSGVSSSMAKVAYSKAIDIWMAICLAFVFLALLEFAIANILARKEDKAINEKKEKAQEKFMNVALALRRARADATKEDEDNQTEKPPPDKPTNFLPKQPIWSSAKIETISRWVFPIAFGVFNVIYWSYFLAN